MHKTRAALTIAGWEVRQIRYVYRGHFRSCPLYTDFLPRFCWQSVRVDEQRMRIVVTCTWHPRAAVVRGITQLQGPKSRSFRLSRDSPPFMEPAGLLPCWHGSTTDSYPESDESYPTLRILFLWVSFNISYVHLGPPSYDFPSGARLRYTSFVLHDSPFTSSTI
jgi:hypothetical protein